MIIEIVFKKHIQYSQNIMSCNNKTIKVFRNCNNEPTIDE